MLRILLLLLVVISVALGVILQMPVLYGVAGALALALLIAWIVSSRGRSKADEKPSSPAGASRDAELASLGISEVRPRTKESAPTQPEAAVTASPEEPEGEDGVEEDTAQAPDTTAHERGVRPATVQRMGMRKRTRGAGIEGLEDRFAQILAPYLQSLRAAIGAQTVCLLKQEDVQPHYQIEAIVSQNAYARSGGHFSTKEPLVTSTSPREVIVQSVGHDGFDPANLGYYRESIQVRQVALAPVPSSGDAATYIMLADSMKDVDLSEPYRQGILAQFASLLRSILDLIELEGKIDEGGSMRPRREIIEEEMERARQEDKHLMFALIHLNEAEEIASGGRIAVAAAERALEAALKRSSADRVERFGELTFGVFHDSDEPEVEPWAEDLQQRLSTGRGALKGGVSIGIVVLKDRHDSADTFRTDATQALREAYETGTCTILE